MTKSSTAEGSVHFTQRTDEWDSPQWLFDALNKEFGFTLDPCCTKDNAKCEKYYTMIENGLLRDWGQEVVFMNPPYSEVAAWMRKAYGAAQEGAVVVCLIPSRTDTAWWHDYCMKGEIRLLRGRLKFGDAENSAPFPSAVVVFRPREFKLVALEPVQTEPARVLDRQEQK